MNANLLEDMRSSSLMILASGVVGIIAFFLPWHLVPGGLSLLGSAIGAGSASAQALFPGGIALAWLEVLASAMLIASPFMASSSRKLSGRLALAGAALGLLLTLYVFVMALIAAIGGSEAVAGQNVFLLLGLGFWAALVGFIAGLLTALAGRREAAESFERANWPVEMVGASASQE